MLSLTLQVASVDSEVNGFCPVGLRRVMGCPSAILGLRRGDSTSPQRGGERDRLLGLKESGTPRMATVQEVAGSGHRRGGKVEVGNGRTPTMGWREQVLTITQGASFKDKGDVSEGTHCLNVARSG